MKKITILMGVLCALILVSCSSNGEEPIVVDEPTNVSLYLDFSFTEGESMSRANSDVYTQFYNEKIKTKELVPDKYQISFKNKETGASYEFNGKWSAKDMITLLTGKYTVTGTCYDTETNYFQSSVSVKFEEDIEVKETTSSITLKAVYDSFLVFFNKSNLTSLEYCANTESNSMHSIEATYGDFYYLFSRDLSSTYNLYIQGKRSNGSSFKVYTSKIPFEKGKYYFFNDATSSFEIPAMEAGN